MAFAYILWRTPATLLAALLLGPVGSGLAETTVPAGDTSGWTWFSAEATNEARAGHVAIALASGDVLVAGGDDGRNALASAERFDAASQTWSSVGPMTVGRRSAAVALLRDGRVIVAGGLGPLAPATSSVEAFDPASRTWSDVAHMNKALGNRTLTVLESGRVLAVGGDNGIAPSASAEVWGGAFAQWTQASSMSTARYGHTGTLLDDGKVLIVGGYSGYTEATRLDSAELYDPTTGQWSATGGSLAKTRAFHTATKLRDGRVLIVGGAGSLNLPRDTCELYDPSSGRFLPAASTSVAHAFHTATLLPDGRVLVVGGRSLAGPVSTAELYDPATNRWSSAGVTATGRVYHTASLLETGEVLVVGGLANGATRSVEIFGAPRCTLSCPSDVEAVAPFGAAEVTVAYAQPEGAASCGPVECTPPSGSVFPIGTTAVTCTGIGAAPCSFTVAVEAGDDVMNIDGVEFRRGTQSGWELVVTGRGFGDHADLHVNGVGFARPVDATNTRVVGAGRMASGRPLGKFVERGVDTTVTVIREDGRTASAVLRRS